MAFLMHLYSNLQSNPFAGSKSRRSPGRQKCHVSSSPQVTAIRHGMSHASVLKQLSTLLQVPNHAGLLAGRNALSCPTPKSQPSDMVCLMHLYSNSYQPFCRFQTMRVSRPAEMPFLVQPQNHSHQTWYVSYICTQTCNQIRLQVPNHAGLQASRNAMSRPALKSQPTDMVCLMHPYLNLLRILFAGSKPRGAPGRQKCHVSSSPKSQPSDMVFLMNLYSNSYQPFCTFHTMRVCRPAEMPSLVQPSSHSHQTWHFS